MKKNETNATQAVAAGASPVSIFNNPEFGSVRIITREDGEPLFCLRDVAACLGYSEPANAVNSRCDEGCVICTPLETAGGTQQVKFGPESEVYRLIFGSKLDSAKKFQDWVFKEVLPSIRKTGSYSVAQQQSSYQIPQTFSEALQLAADIQKENERLVLENKKHTTKIEEDAPKVECWNKFVGESNELISITDFAKVLHNKWSDITPHRLFAILREAKILQDGYFNKNIPYQYYIKEGYFKVKEKPSVNKVGLNFVSRQTLVTPKGQKYLIGKFLSARASDEENDIDIFE